MAETNLTKSCLDCPHPLPLSEFYLNHPKKKKPYYSPRCKTHTKLKSNEWYHANKERARETFVRYRQTHKEQIFAMFKRHRETHREALKKKKAEYFQRNKARCMAKNKLQRHNNRERTNELSRIWRAEHPERRRASVKKNKAKRKAALGTCSAEQWIAKCEYWAWHCYLCGIPVTSATLHMEHRKPLSRGRLAFGPQTSPRHAKDATYQRTTKPKPSTAVL